VRAATSPTTTVVVLQPFGGEMRTKNLTRFAIQAGYDAYQSESCRATAPCDEHAMLVDLYPRAKLGLMGADPSVNCSGAFCSGQAPGPTANSCDGTHPLAHRHAHLGAMVAAEVAARLATLESNKRAMKSDDTGAVRTMPPLRFITWNRFGCKGISGQVLMDTADSFVALGLDKLGYEFINSDDCWM